MASGHVYRTNSAEHMAAPTNPEREDSSCQPGAVYTDLGSARRYVRFQQWSGPRLGIVECLLLTLSCPRPGAAQVRLQEHSRQRFDRSRPRLLILAV